MTVYAKYTDLDWGCGVTVIGDFINFPKYETQKLEIKNNWVSGTGFFISSFINTAICKEAYQTIQNNFEIVYQSPVKNNYNSGNKFFFIVYRKK